MELWLLYLLPIFLSKRTVSKIANVKKKWQMFHLVELYDNEQQQKT